MPAYWNYGGYFPITGNEVLLVARGQNGGPIVPGLAPVLYNVFASQLGATGGGSGTISTGLSGTGSSQFTAALLAAQTSIFTTVAPNTGCVLPVPATGQFIVLNRGANNLLCYPGVGCQIENAGVNTAVELQSGTGSATFIAASATQWYVR